MNNILTPPPPLSREFHTPVRALFNDTGMNASASEENQKPTRRSAKQDQKAGMINLCILEANYP